MTGQILSYRGVNPEIHPSVFIAPTAVVIGNVEIGADASIWFNTVLRGDVNTIKIGAGTNIQDLTMVHVNNEESPRPSTIVIGDNVTVGHQVLLHGCHIGDECLIGMGSILMDDVCVEKNSVVGAGSLVTTGMIIPAGHLAFGRPAKVIRPLTAEEIFGITVSAQHYQKLAKSYGFPVAVKYHP